MKLRKIVFPCIVLLIMGITSGCALNKSKEPIDLTIWHVYGGQTDSPLNDMIDEFNQTVGKEEGICVQVTSVTNTNTIHEGVLAAANKEPGAAELPDMFVSYPKTVLAMPDQEVLVDYRDYFSEEEFEKFMPEFLEEGVIDNRQVILPVAKSTEVMFINKTGFDRFAKDTGVQLSDLQTWEKLYEVSEMYTAWSDAQTPDIPDDGKAFFVHDYHFNYFQVGVESLGEAFFQGDTIAFGDAFRKVWDPYAKAALKGAVWLYEGYATEPLRTGDAIVSVASSASILYYSDVVTYADNTSEEIEIIAMPCPIFEDGETMVMQRGAGICTVKSEPKREKAACVFLKWLTEAENNVRFVTQTGYMPVLNEAFTDYLPEAIESLEDPKYVELYKAYLETQENYQFYTAPLLDTYLELETSFEKGVRLQLSIERNAWLKDGGKEELLENAVEQVLRNVEALYE